MPGSVRRPLRRLDAGTPVIVKVSGPVMVVALGMALYLEGAVAPEDCSTAACRALSEQVSLVTTDGTALLLVVLWLVFVLFVGRRAHRLADVARRVADGDLSARVGDTTQGHPRDELMLVGQQFDRMLDTLVDEQDRLRELTAELEHQADHDALTGLGNRRALHRRLARAGVDLKQPMALVLVDVDGFRSVNEGLGHDVGDLVLTTTALRLSGCLRTDGELEAPVRLDGDEFAVLVPGVTDAADATALAERLLRATSTPLEVEGATLVLGASAGVVLVRPGDEREPQDVVRDAGLALKAARREPADHGSPGRSAVFADAMRQDVVARRQMVGELRTALDDGELLVHFQPFARAASPGQVAGFEALVRWRHPVRGLVSPAEFVPVAEDSGLIRPIGLWVLEQAASTAAAWHALLPGRRFTTNVNLAPQQLLDADLQRRVADVLERTGLPPQLLTLELTETAMMLDVERAAARLEALRALGVRIAIDDFGTGSSSLAYLHRLPVDVVKIDKAFVSRMEAEPAAMAMVRAVLAIASSLGMTTVAEGVETPGQLTLLRDLGCDKVQGYLLSPPVAADDARLLLLGDRPFGGATGTVATTAR